MRKNLIALEGAPSMTDCWCPLNDQQFSSIIQSWHDQTILWPVSLPWFNCSLPPLCTMKSQKINKIKRCALSQWSKFISLCNAMQQNICTAPLLKNHFYKSCKLKDYNSHEWPTADFTMLREHHAQIHICPATCDTGSSRAYRLRHWKFNVHFNTDVIDTCKVTIIHKCQTLTHPLVLQEDKQSVIHLIAISWILKPVEQFISNNQWRFNESPVCQKEVLYESGVSTWKWWHQPI